jgi:hypothetical protein
VIAPSIVEDIDLFDEDRAEELARGLDRAVLVA